MRSQARASSMVEIIIAIGVLAIVSMFVLQLFVKASNIQQKAHDLDIACLEAQSLMEDCKAGGELQSKVYYDGEWNRIDEEDKNGFVISMSVQPNESLNIVKIKVEKNSPYLMETQNPVVYELEGSLRAGVASR